MRYFITFMFLWSYGNVGFTQITDTIAHQTIEVNNIKFTVRADGLLFADQGEGGFVHQPSGMDLLDGVGLWMGGLDPAGNLKIAIEYPNVKNNKDFVPGVLSDAGVPLEEYDFNKIWTVTGDDIERHIADYEDNWIIDDTIPSIFGWPGRRNPFFADYHTNALPETTQILAPYKDRNYNGKYEPNLGDYPHIENRSTWPYPIPASISWSVCHDGIPHRLSNVESLQMEIHTTVFTFECAASEFLNNSVFVKRHFFNKAIESIDSTYIGTYNNFTLGCPNDYYGTIPELHTIYAYNAQFEPDVGCNETNPDVKTPLIAITRLFPTLGEVGNYTDTYSIPMADSHPDSTWSHGMGTYFPRTPWELYNNLTNSWVYGNPLMVNEDGYGGYGESTGEVVHHLYDRRLFDSMIWAEDAFNRPAGKRRVLFTEGPSRFDPRRSNSHTMVYTAYPPLENELNRQDVIDRIAANAESIFYHPHVDPYEDYPFRLIQQGLCDSTVGTTESIDNKLNLYLYPNPTNDYFTIKLPDVYSSNVDVVIYSQFGQLVKAVSVNTKQETLSIKEFSAGIYWVIAQSGEQKWLQKLVIL